MEIDPEKKKYTVLGTVTIGTDEYRDLLTETHEAKRSLEKRDGEYWQEYREKRAATERAEKAEKQLQTYTEFFGECPDAKALLANWRLKKAQERMEEEEAR